MAPLPAQAPYAEQDAAAPAPTSGPLQRRISAQGPRPARPIRGAAQSSAAFGHPLPSTNVHPEPTTSVAPRTPVLVPDPRGGDANAPVSSSPPRAVPASAPVQPSGEAVLPPTPAPAPAPKPASEPQKLSTSPTQTSLEVAHRLFPPETVPAKRTVHSPPAISAPRPESRPEPARPRGLRKLFALMTCSSASTQAAALEQPAAPSPAEPKVRTEPPKVVAPSTLPDASDPSAAGSAAANAPPGTLGQPEPDTHLPSRDSVIGPPSTSAHGEDPDEYGGGIIASVGQAAGAGLPYEVSMMSEQELFEEEQQLISQGGTGIPLDEHGHPQPLLPAPFSVNLQRKCLVLDLDETLVHSSFKMVPNADFVVPVEIDGVTHSVYVIKRPGVDEFLRRVGQLYEVVIFTASLNKYADPVIDILDVHHVVHHRLFRESCYNHHGNYVKDLSQLGRPLHDTIILDNSPASYIFHPTNAVPVSSWFNDPHDTELTDLCPFLQDLVDVGDVRIVLDGFIHPE